MQIVFTIAVGSFLLSRQKTPFESILSKNAEILRKTSARGAKYCGLNDSCIIFTYNMPSVVTILSVMLGVVALLASFIVKMLSPKVKSAVRSARLSLALATNGIGTAQDIARPPKIEPKSALSAKKEAYLDTSSVNDNLTSFERNCIGAPFKKLFRDCDDMAYVIYKGKRCTTVEALLLTGYLFHGEHIYQASSVMLLLLARLVPRRVLRTFNLLLLRWHVDPKDGTLSHALSCTWYTASKENHQMAGATPVA